jgi:NADH/NAD ratio-sensing transcriptional regulator Rex
MTITQVHLVLVTIKVHSKMCSFVTQHNATEVLRERSIGMLNARISTRAVARECNVNLSTIRHLQRCFENLGVRTTGLVVTDFNGQRLTFYDHWHA